MRGPTVLVVLTLSLTAVAAGGTARAGETVPAEDEDLSLIPPPPTSPAAAPATGALRKIFLEDAFTQSWLQSALVPEPPPPDPRWEERALLDVRREWHAGRDLRLTYSGRLNLRAEDGLGFPNHENLTNDLREAYLSWEPLERVFLDVGRVNLKSGVALGFNPTDFFKTRAVVEPLSVDPVVLRDDRLGTLLLRAERVWARGSLTAVYAPAVAGDSPIYTRLDLRSFDPMFDRTNAHERWLLKGTIDVADGLSPELLAYSSAGRTLWGANLAANVGQSVVAYLEWSGGRRGTVSADALGFGRVTGSLPAAAASVLPDLGSVGFRNQLAVGASYTTALPRITFNLEFHYNQAGFSGADWQQWFRTGSGASSESPIAGALWYVREYAADQQELISHRNAFLRADWVDAFVPKLELSGFIEADLADGSSRLQLGADYYLSDRWTLGGLVLIDSGGRRSDFGSLPEAGSVLLKMVRYF
ncbi:MAG TPA: hypothetical protein VEU54_02330 [Steroidobacteraceae bacterium]|nr:hypothetical protein [Steroidobacteraceae bacterium]